jgi:hypothetical protein
MRFTKMDSPEANPRKLLSIVEEACEGKVVVPEFQRSFIWERRDIQELLSSILQGYFIGAFLILDIYADNPMFPFRPIEGLEKVNEQVRFDRHPTVQLVLDGQQRITSVFYALYSPDIPLRNSKFSHKFYLLLDAALNGDIEEAVVGVSLLDRRRMSKIQEMVRTHHALPFSIFREPNTFYQWLYQEQNVWDGETQWY